MPAGPAYFRIATTTLTSPTFTVTFSSLSGYTDLTLVTSYVPVNPGDIYVNYNGSGTQVTTTSQFTFGGGLNTNRLGTFYLNSNSQVAGRAVGVFDLFSYNITNNYKTAFAFHGNPSTCNTHVSGTWLDGSAITSISINATSQFNTGSVFSLYGILAA